MGEKVGEKLGEKVGEKTGEKVGESLGEIDKLNLCHLIKGTRSMLALLKRICFANLFTNSQTMDNRHWKF